MTHLKWIAGAAGALALAACQPANPASETAEAAPPATCLTQADQACAHAFMIGQLQAWALRDGVITVPVGNENLPWGPPEAIAGALTTAGEAADAVHLAIQPLLVRDGEQLVLIDSGAGGQMGSAGLLLASLAEAGFQPADVTDVLISHAHGDHIGGLLTADGQPVFPNATIRMTAQEWDAFQAEPGSETLVAAITPRVETFQPGARVTPSILSAPLPGHTPGHSGYDILSGEERLLYIGDSLHSSILSVAHPDWVNAWDFDSDTAVQTREALMAGAADDSRIIYGVHFPYPGRGRFQRQGEGYVWTPEAG